MAVLEGSIVARIEGQLKNIAHNPLPILDHTTFTQSGSIGGLQCIVVFASAGVGPVDAIVTSTQLNSLHLSNTQLKLRTQLLLRLRSTQTQTQTHSHTH